MEVASGADLILSALTPQIRLAEERPAQPDDFPDSVKQQSLLTLQTLASRPPFALDQLPCLLILLCEHLPPPLFQDQLSFLPPDDSDGRGVIELSVSPPDDSGSAYSELLWSSPEHRQLAETILAQILAAEGVDSFEKLLGR